MTFRFCDYPKIGMYLLLQFIDDIVGHDLGKSGGCSAALKRWRKQAADR